jgi:hypothetical protein
VKEALIVFVARASALFSFVFPLLVAAGLIAWYAAFLIGGP